MPRPDLDRAVRKALAEIDPQTDSIRVYSLCAACTPRVDVYGRIISVGPEPLRIL